VCMQRIMAFASFRSGTFEHLMQGEAVTLLADGRLDPAALQRNAISRDTLYAALRGQEVMTLGSLERVYLEPDGSFTVIRAMAPRPGLTLVPAWDRELIEEQAKSSEQRACEWCGTITPTWATAQPCSFCASTTWTSAVEARFRSPAGT